MTIRIQGAREHNLQGIDLEIGEGLTVVTGVSGSGKTSLVFDTLYHEARRRFLELFAVGAAAARLAPARVDSITGLGPAVAVGQNLLNRNPASNLASASGLHPFLRLLYARFGQRVCPKCGVPLTVFSQDEMLEHLMLLSREAPVRLLAPLLRAVPGSHAVLIGALAGRFGPAALRVDGLAWDGAALDPYKPHHLDLEIARLENSVALHEIRRALEDIWALGVNGVTVVLPDREETLSRAPVCMNCGSWLGDLAPADFHRTCPHCQGLGCTRCAGSGLPPEAAAVRWKSMSFTELLALSVEDVHHYFDGAQESIPSPRLLDEINRRLNALERVGLGYISLNRSSPTLSRGEAQRVRLAVTLISRLEDMLHILDEPTVGLHALDVQRLIPAFRELPGPVVFVEHDRIAAAEADIAVDIGPGAGRQGGQLLFRGSPTRLWQAETPSGRWFSLRERGKTAVHRPVPQRFIVIRGAHLRNLQEIDVPIPLGCLTVISGVSGSGKSTFVEGVLVPSLESGTPTGCRALEGPKLKAVIVDQSPIGRNPRSNPATYTKLADLLRDLYALVSGLSPSHFSFNRPEGACPTCQGLGAVEVTMRYLPSTWLPCVDCAGQRFSEEVLAVRLNFDGQSLSMADFLDLSAADALALLTVERRMTAAARRSAVNILEALCEIGLGYLTLGQPSTTLSGGEAQRVKLAKTLSLKSLSNQVLVLDEPSTGLHPQDLAGLLAVLDRLVWAGATIVVVEHNLDILRAADWVVDLGPGAGPHGGRLLYAGPPEGLAGVSESRTARALAEEEHVVPRTEPPATQAGRAEMLSIRGARAHNLKGVDVDFPKGALTVVTGVSGSGKSSLVSDVLETEARRRFLETLSLYERQATHEGPEAEVESVSGLGVALSVTPERLVYSRRATVGTATELIYLLAVLLSAAGRRTCLVCGAEMQRSAERWLCPVCGELATLGKPQHFTSSTYASACLKCHGVGTLQVPQPAKLIIHPEKPLVEGAMYSPGFFPNGYLGKPFNHGYYWVLALGECFGFDPHTTPWNEMSEAAQQAFLFGSREVLTAHLVGHSGRTSVNKGTFPGFYGFVRDWDVGGTYTDTLLCPECGGSRLRPEYLAVTLVGCNIHQLSQLPLIELEGRLNGVELPEETPALASGSLVAVLRRLDFLCRVGLSYLNLDRVAGTLSAGEVQRVRMAGLLGGELTSLTLLLDEPTRGLHPQEVQALLGALQELSKKGNTVVVVEHDPLIMLSADHLIDMGPGAGVAGGQVTAQGSPAQVLRSGTLTARWLSGTLHPNLHLPRRTPQRWMVLRGARANNLQNLTVKIPMGVLCGVCGVSGSGKSTLMIETLGRILVPRKQTTSVAYEPLDAGEYDSIEGAPARTLLVDQTKAGVASPAVFLDLLPPLRALFADSEDAHALGIGEQQLSARCSACGGSGVITHDMAFLPDMHIPCETCRGSGFLPEVWQVRLGGLSLPEVLGLTIDQIEQRFRSDPHLTRALHAAQEVGLGYLVLRQPGYALSGGEAQRLKIAQELSRKNLAGALFILDEPTVGQHLEDVQRLVGVLHRLVDEGGSVLVVEHHPHLLAACDWLIELGPGGGPQGGQLTATGTPEDLAYADTATALYLREILEAKR